MIAYFSASKKRLASIPASLVFALSLMALAPSPVVAGQVFVNRCTGGVFEQHQVFDVADTICIDGTISSLDFITFFADAYIIPNQTWSGGESLVDIRSENRVNSGVSGGLFLGWPIGQPGGTPRGEYDVILDDGANGRYDPGFDGIVGAGPGYGIIVVESGRPIPDVSAMKARAAAMETSNQAVLARWHLMLDLIDAYNLASAVASGPIGILEYALWKPYNDLTGDFAHKIMGGYGPNPNPPPPRQAFGVLGHEAKRWGDLARDPPDPLFDVLVPLDIASAGTTVQDYVGTYSYPFQPVGTTQREANMVAWGNLGVQQAALVHALRQTFEKYQGADQADDDPYTWLQARQLIKYSEMLQANITASIASVTLVRADIIAAGDNSLQDVSAMAALQQRVIASGLTTEEQDAILAMGFTPADITEIELRIEGWILPTTDGRVTESLDALIVEMTDTRAQLVTLASEAQALMAYLLPDFTLEHPTADAGGPYNGVEGTPVTLDGTGSTDPQADISTYEWDLDGDGVFDDAAGTGPTHQWDSEFIGSIGLKVTDALGNWDIAYADVVIGSANTAPEIFDFQPTSTTPSATAVAPLNFSVAATDADGDPLTYEWSVDGVSVGAGTSYVYTPAITDSGSVVVQVLVSDSSPFSVDVTESRRVNVYSDSDGDSYYSDVDCNDANSAVNPAATDICNNIDDNCDGTIDEGFDIDGDGVSDCDGDCDDNDPNNYPGNTEVCDLQDNNCDGSIDELLNDDLDGDGLTVCGGDCDDGDSANYPGNSEVCDGQDNNCDGASDEGLTFDLDGDGYSTAASCQGTRDDCDDGSTDVNPGASEVCDLIDNNCDGAVDEGYDADGDSYSSCDGDCNDGDASINPLASEICDDVDNNCDGFFDEGFDGDGDGITTCGTVSGSGGGTGIGDPDCDDGDGTSYPGAMEICDGIDNNCDGAIDEGVNDDLDGDGLSVCAGDCDDADPNNFPGNAEICDLSDNNCDSSVDEGFDVDGDGFSVCASPVADCDDSNADVYSGRTEVFHNGFDDDCDAGTLDDYANTFIIVPDDSGRIYYARSNGDGSWADYRQIATLSGVIRGAAIADYDSDGDLDFVVGSPSGQTMRFHYFENDGADNFTDGGVFGTGSSAGSNQMDMTAGDFDHDGDMDFRSNGNSAYMHEGLGDGNGNFTVTTINTGIASGRGMDSADFNHDGHLDLVRATYSNGQVILFLGDGSGNFTNSGLVGDPGTDPYGVTAADFNNDGHPDVLANNGGGGDPYFYAGNGDGTFVGGVYVASADHNNHGAFDNYDFNRDGNQDLVATSYTSRKIYYYPGNGDGTFGASVLINPSNTAGNILGISAPPGPPPAGDPIPWITPNPYIGTKADTVDLSGEFSTDDGNIVSYSWNFGDGNTGVGRDVSHPFPNIEDEFHVKLEVTDDEGKVAIGTGRVLLLGDPPTADAGGPYTFGEDFALGGVYTVPLDGSGSTDDGADPLSYQWDLGDSFSEDFAGGVIDPAIWSADDASIGAEEVTVTGAGWGNSYLVTRRTFPRSAEISTFTGRVGTVVNPTVMWGLKNTNENYSYTQFPYAIYFYNNSWIYIYEDGASRGNKVQYTEGNDYEVRIDVKPGSGATYYFRAVGSTSWVEIYDSTHSSASTFRLGATVNGGAIRLDDFDRRHESSDEMPSVIYATQDTFNVSLTVTDIADQSDTDNTTVETVAGARPVAHPGGPYTPGEANASCGTYTVAFDGSASSDDSGRIFQYDWDFGDGSMGTGVAPSHEFVAGGPVPSTYTVTLTVTDHALQQNTLTTTTMVNPAPGAFPVASTDNYNVDESAANAGIWTVNFDGSGSSDDNGLCDYVWDFGDGGSGTGPTPSHQYSAAGDYTGTLTVRDHALQSQQVSFNVQVAVNDPPVADDGGPYAVDESAVENGQWTVDLDASGSTDDFGVWNYGWDFGDGNTGTGETVTHAYVGAGAYVVTLTVTDNAGQTTQTTTQVTVNANDPPVADAGPNLLTERGLPVTLDASGSSDDFGILSYRWDFGLPPFMEDFSGALDSSRWTTGGATVSGGEALITGAGGWGNRYLVSNDSFIRAAGDSYTGRLQTDSGGNRYVMWGLKNTNNDYNYTQFYYAIYFNNGNVSIYENGSNRGVHNSYTDNTSYDVRIDVKAGAGATYFYRETGAPAWIQLYDSAHSGAGTFRFGATVHSGLIHLDDFVGPAPTAGTPNTASLVAPTITYAVAGSYQPAVTVTDQALQTDTDSTTVSVVEGDAPVANGGGPYQTNEDIPTRFNGRASTDDFAIKTYEWDFGDGESLITRNPWVDHRYTAPGTLTASLTVTDYAGHTDTDSFSVVVSPEPVVATVPWAFSGGIEVPHETWDGKQVTLKGVTWSNYGPWTYEWDFGDGSSPVSGAVSNKRVVQATHTYNGEEGKPFVATLTVTDANGQSASDTYPVRIRAKSLDTEINVAIDDGLWWLHANQNQGEFSAGSYRQARIDHGFWDNGGGWGGGAWVASPTSSALQAFEVNAHLELGDVRENPYVETVSRGLRHLPTRLQVFNTTMQTYGDPDTNANGIAVETTRGSDTRPPYEVGQVMDALVASGSQQTYAITGPANVIDRNYHDLAVDMVDAYAWGQYDSASVGGGWRYGWNSHPDNSAAQWGAIGMLAAEEVWGVPIPQWVKDRNDVWMTYSYNGTRFGYTGGGNGTSTTPSGLVQLAFNDKVGFDDPATADDDRDSRWRTAEDYIANNWNGGFWLFSSGTRYSYYAYYAFTKAMRSAHPEPIVNLHATGLDWFKDNDNGIARRLINRQQSDGGWPRDGNPGGTYVGYDLTTGWSVIMLTPTLFVQPPVADAGSNRVWGVDVPITLDASGSFHLDPFRSIVSYEWDVDGDGVFDSDSTSPTITHTYATADYPESSLPQTVTVRLRVTDNNDPTQTDTDTVNIIIAVPPHPPVADVGGPYSCTAGIPCMLDGSGSFDIDPTDFITAWEWDLDNDGDYDDANGVQPEVVFPVAGQSSIGLRVVDNAVLNDVDGDGVQDPEERLDDFDFISATVHANNPPVADANGPYTIDEGSSALLDASGSIDLDGNPLTYAWDLDNDGNYDDATGVNASFPGIDDGTFTVGLEVSDSLLSDSMTTLVVVQNVAPIVDAGPNQSANEGSTVNFGGSFTDPGVNDTHTMEWDFGDGSPPVSGTLNPSHVYAEDGVYIATLTVTDDDGGVGTDTLKVTVNNVPPLVDAGPNAGINEGDSFVSAGSFTDPGPDTWTATVDYGDGTGVQSLALNPDKSFDLSHPYPANGIYLVTVTVTDDDGGVGVDTAQVAVGDVAPVVDAGPDAAFDEGGTLASAGSFIDPGTDTWTATVDYGDGSGVQALALNPDKTFDLSHPYPVDGIYVVTVTVTDDDGGVGADTMQVTVADTGGTLPEPPISDLTARAKDSKIDLVWAPMQGASGYNVSRSTSQGGPYSPIAGNHQCSYCAYADFGLTNGTTYYYVVTWTNAAGESLASNEASATPQAGRRRR